MGRKVTVAVSTLNQWALDFDGNHSRILQSIIEAREMGATYRTGPELEITGYSCEDHFLEPDTFLHSWEVLLKLLLSPLCQNMLIDVGMPVQHRNVSYNCRVIFLNAKIVFIRPKLSNCDDGNYRETRWFTPWAKRFQTEVFYLPRMIAQKIDQMTCPFGDALIATRDTCLGHEVCEELWNVKSTHIEMSLSGAEIIVNASGSYMQLRKAHVITDLVKSASSKAGGAYLYCNSRGCDGQRVLFNGCSSITLNGDIISRGKQFSLQDVEVTTATFDLEDIRAHRIAVRSRCHAAASCVDYPRVSVDFELTKPHDLMTFTSFPMEWVYHTPEEEIAYGPASWLWDYLRRSGQGGFFLPLSGGVDSSSTATIVHAMCRMVLNAIQCGDIQVLEDVRKILGDQQYVPETAAALCNRLLVTCYMGGQNSSEKTRKLASTLADQLGSYHLEINIDPAISALLAIFKLVTGTSPKFRKHGGCARQNLALQNIQARTRMVLAYLFAQLILWVRDRPGGLLVLASANVDESLRGYMTKYDCSSADINPIGGISKNDLKSFLNFAKTKFDLPIISEIIDQPPTAELEPLDDGHVVQTDEQDMGMTYDELSQFGKLRKQQYCGPYSMFCRLVSTWNDRYTPQEVANKVKHFFRCYAINRHKMTVLTPSVHAESYSPDDNRFDHRPFLYRANWLWQFRAIDDELKNLDVSKREASTEQRDGRDSSLSRRHSHKDFKTSLSTLSFGGHGHGHGHGSFAGEKRHSLRSNSSVMGKIKDRTGIPV